MKTPDKIYIDIEYPREPYGVKKEDLNDVCYIRKNAILDWLKDRLKENEKCREICPSDRFFGGKGVAFEDVKDKINSL